MENKIVELVPTVVDKLLEEMLLDTCLKGSAGDQVINSERGATLIEDNEVVHVEMTIKLAWTITTNH